MKTMTFDEYMKMGEEESAKEWPRRFSLNGSKLWKDIHGSRTWTHADRCDVCEGKHGKIVYSSDDFKTVMCKKCAQPSVNREDIELASSLGISLKDQTPARGRG